MFFWFHVKNISITSEGRQHFYVRKLHGFHEKLNDGGKLLSFSFTIKKSYEASQKLTFQRPSQPGI